MEGEGGGERCEGQIFKRAHTAPNSVGIPELRVCRFWVWGFGWFCVLMSGWSGTPRLGARLKNTFFESWATTALELKKKVQSISGRS